MLLHWRDRSCIQPEELPNGSNIVLQLHKLRRVTEHDRPGGQLWRGTFKKFEQELDRKIPGAGWLAGGAK